MLNILIVEDDTAIASMYKFKIEAYGHKAKIAHNGLEALRTIKDFKPDLILLDLRMPVIDGEKFLEKFRKKDSETKIIVLTNLNREEAPKTLWHYGISGYFVKAHSTPKDLINIIDKVYTN